MAKSPAVPHPLPHGLADAIAQRFRVLSDPTRADDSVFEMCETVCGGLRRQLDEFSAPLEGVDA